MEVFRSGDGRLRLGWRLLLFVMLTAALTWTLALLLPAGVLWGSVALLVKAVAESRGWRHELYASLWEVVRRLRRELGDDSLTELFGLANQLHANFYEGWLDADDVRIIARRVGELVDRLRRLVGRSVS